MHDLVKILAREGCCNPYSGERYHEYDVDKDEQVWCLVIDSAGSNAALCSNEVFGDGEGDAIYKEKSVMRGGITCKKCLRDIKYLKSIKL